MVKEKIDWKFEYGRDCAFNIGTWLLMGLALIFEPDPVGMFIIVLTGFMVNLMASKFFISNKYY